MQMEYRFSLTPRLVAVGLFSLIALFVLLFLLGMQVGLRTAKADLSQIQVPAENPLTAAKEKVEALKAAPGAAAEAAKTTVTAPAKP